jgi:multimeric flavodoxin WrbA
MKIIGICYSPRKGGTTAEAMALCMEAAREAALGAETELLELAGLDLRGCIACGRCRGSLACSQDDDFTRTVLPALSRPEVAGILVGTPVYLGSMTSQCKAFLDRTVPLRRNGFRLRDVVEGVLAVGGVQHGGQQLAIQVVQAALLCHDMVVVSDGRPTAHFRGRPLERREGRPRGGLGGARDGPEPRAARGGGRPRLGRRARRRAPSGSSPPGAGGTRVTTTSR